MKVSVVVLNWNGAPDLAPCLSALEAERGDALEEVIVVDNASEDDSCNIVRDNFPWVRLIPSDSNLGCAGGRNLGWINAKGDVVFFLDSDASVEPGCIRALKEVFTSNQRLGVAGCVVRDQAAPHEIQEAGMSIDRYGFMLSYEARRQSLPPFYVSGCSMAIRRSLADIVGMFDERYFIFAEEIDLCWRCRLIGFDVTVAPGAVVRHRGGTSFLGGLVRGSRYRTSAQRVYLRERNTMASLIKNYSAWSLIRRLPVYLLIIAFEFLVALFLLQWQWAIQYPRAMVWNVRNLPGTLRLRRHVRRVRQRPDHDLPFDNRFAKLVVFRRVGIPRVHG
jgi:GT2 family glycosyltransferase